VEMTFVWTPSETSEADPGMHLQSFENPKHLLSSLPRQGRTQGPSLTVQSHKLPSAVRWFQQHKSSRTVYPHFNVVIERPSLVLTPPQSSSLRLQNTSWR
jgi:hypothetical protein